MRKMFRRLLPWFALAGLAGCPAPVPLSPVEPLTIAFSAGYPGSCPLLVAQDMALFTKFGVSVRLEPMASGVQAMDTALEGKADLAASSDVHFMLSVLEGRPVNSVGAIARFDGGTSLVMRGPPGSDIAAFLKGKRIAVTLRTAGHYALGIILARHGLAQSDVKLVDMPPQKMREALAREEVDGAATWEPFLSRATQALGADNSLRIGTESLYVGHWLLVGRNQQLVSKRASIERLLQALDQATAHCEGPDAAGRKLMIRQGRLSAEEAASAWPHFQFDVTLDQGLIVALEDQSDWAKRQRIVPGDAGANFLSHLDSAALRAALPSNITLVE